MDTAFDPSKFIGSASAPVALVIASAILMGNLAGKYSAMFGATRGLFNAYRDNPDEHRRRLLGNQLIVYGRRLRLLMRAMTLLGVAVECFAATVALAGTSVIFPKVGILSIATAMSMVGGLLAMAIAVVCEVRENLQAKLTLHDDFDEFPELRDEAHRRAAETR